MILFVSDLDGTLLNDAEVLDADVAERINGLIEGGLKFTIATARAFPSIKMILRDLSLRLPIVEQNGAILRDFQTGEILEWVAVADEMVHEILDVFATRDLDPIVSVLDGNENPYFHRRLVNDGMEWFVGEKRAKGCRQQRPVPDFDACRSIPVLSFTYLGAETQIQSLASAMHALGTDITITHYDNRYTRGWEINVSARSANKGSGVESLRRRIGGVTQVVAFGDNHNDKSMLQAADLAVAVANAPAEIRSLCRHVTHRNVDRGVLRFIEDYLAGR